MKGGDWFGHKAQRQQLVTASKAVQSALAMGKASADFEKLSEAERQAAEAEFAQKMQDSVRQHAQRVPANISDAIALPHTRWRPDRVRMHANVSPRALHARIW